MREPLPYGRFVLLDRIAVGGMAEVYVAIRRGDPAEKLYALKRILPSLAEDEGFITMFLDEARLVVQLDHPAIVAIHELGKQGEGYYIAMDYVAGRDLRALLDRCRVAREPLPVPFAAAIAARIADALDHAHRKRDARGEALRVVHRDVSPANVLLAFDGSVRILDFGIAQAAIRTRHEDTVLRGKFGYMSPEMVRGQPVDRRSDVFALGAVLHEMLTGERLFTGTSELATLEAVRAAAVPPPSGKRPGLPAGLDAVVLRALAREPEDRHAWASDLRDALLPYAAGGDPPALARLMARRFPADLRAELDRLDRLRAEPLPRAPAAIPEATQVIDLHAPPGASDREEALPAAPAPAAPAATAGAPATPLLRAGTAAAAVAVAGLVASVLLAVPGRRGAPTAAVRAPIAAVAVPAPGIVPPPPRDAAPVTLHGTLRIQPRAAATLVLDGVAVSPPLAGGETRELEVSVGEHRIELRTEDGRRAGATVQVSAGEMSELLGFDVQ
jgi:eukaryotic-like serine/threonine-protein kinase